jgi:hypothetical protein
MPHQLGLWHRPVLSDLLDHLSHLFRLNRPVLLDQLVLLNHLIPLVL